MIIYGSRLDCISTAELKIYDKFKSLDLQDWRAIFNLARHDSRNRKDWETDIVLIGKNGIIVLEIKGGGVYRDPEGHWYSRDKDGMDNPIKNPIQQSRHAKYELKKLLKRHIPESKYWFFGEGVIVPDTDIGAISTEENKFFIDKKILNETEKTLKKFIKSSSFIGAKTITKNQINHLISDVLLPRIGLMHNPAQLLRDYDDEFIRLNDEQYKAFQGLLDNPRVATQGPAGSGKTILALKLAQHNHNKKIKTLLVSYNQALSAFLSFTFQGECADSKYVDVKNLDNLIAEYLGEEGLTYEIGSRERSDLFLKKVNNDLAFAKYDYLIIDEAHDLLVEKYFYILDSIIKGGLSEGSWAIFFDENQSGIYSPENEPVDLSLLLGGINITSYKLSRNMRNTKCIVEEATKITALQPGHPNNIEGIAPEVIIYTSTLDQAKKVCNMIIKLTKKDGYKFREISIVSANSISKSLVNTGMLSVEGCSIENVNNIDWSDYAPNVIVSGTARNFKGLDNRVIIATDLENVLVDDLYNKLNYITATRAKNHLVLFMNKSSYKRYKRKQS